MKVPMQNARNVDWTRLPRILLLAAAAAFLVAADAVAADPAAVPALDPPALLRALATIHPDYRLYISSVRALPTGVSRRLYMALVRPGANDPAGRDSAPYAGAGARNDIVYDEAAIFLGHSPAWRTLLLAHEYFHARHLAEATLLPVVRGSGVKIERHYNEAAAWGFNVAEARAGRYPGLRPDEFREALDRQGEHYAALKALLKESDPERWGRIADLLRQPDALFTTAASPPPASPARPSGSGQSPATP